MQAMKEAKKNYRGRPPILNPRTIPTVVHLSVIEIEAVNAAAQLEDRSRSWWIRKAISEKLERDAASQEKTGKTRKAGE